MNFQSTVDIKAPVIEVFEFVTAMRNTPKWTYFVTRVIQENGNGPALGASYHQTRQRDSQRYEITHFEVGQTPFQDGRVINVEESCV